MRKLDRSRQASKFLRTLPPKHARQIAQKLEALLSDPAPADSAPLHGADDYRRVTVGEYRLIYRFTDDTVFLAVAGLGTTLMRTASLSAAESKIEGRT
jgi:mRNA interferase RelE/StbE